MASYFRSSVKKLFATLHAFYKHTNVKQRIFFILLFSSIIFLIGSSWIASTQRKYTQNARAENTPFNSPVPIVGGLSLAGVQRYKMNISSTEQIAPGGILCVPLSFNTTGTTNTTFIIVNDGARLPRVVYDNVGSVLSAGDSFYFIGGTGGKPFEPYYSRNWKALDGTNRKTTQSITTSVGGDMAKILQSQKEGITTYQVTNQGRFDAQYNITMHFADFDSNAEGERVFSVSVAGGGVANIDVFKEAGGKLKHISKTFTAQSTGGILNISFSKNPQSNRPPILNAIEIEAIKLISPAPCSAAGVTTVPTPSSSVTTSPTPLISSTITLTPSPTRIPNIGDPTDGPSPSASPTIIHSPTLSPSLAPTTIPSATPTRTITHTPHPTIPPSATITRIPSATSTPLPTNTPFIIPSPWPTARPGCYYDYSVCPGQNACDQAYQSPHILCPTATPTSTPGPQDKTFTFYIRFQGINGVPKVNSMNVSVGLFKGTSGTSADYSSQGQFRSDTRGVWEGRVTFKNFQLKEGEQIYFVVKGPKHLEQKVCSYTPTEITPGTYQCSGTITYSSPKLEYDFSEIYQVAGDVGDQDGIIDSSDVIFIRQHLGSTRDSDLAIGDLDGNGVIDTKDYSLVLASLARD